jgi:hypothetical protein
VGSPNIIYVPDKLIDQLIKNGTMKMYKKDKRSECNILCNATDVQFTLQLDKQTITVDKSSFLSDWSEFEGYCLINVLPYGEYGYGQTFTSGYFNQPAFVLGTAFTDLLCLGYDFGANKLGLGFPKFNPFGRDQ